MTDKPKPTPVQLAEAEENKQSWHERFERAISEIEARHAQGHAPTAVLCRELRVLQEAVPGSKKEQVKVEKGGDNG